MSNVPYWVFAILVGLVILGLLQARPSRASRGKVLTMPLVITLVSLSAIVQLFGWNLAALAAWGLGLSLLVAKRRLISFSAQASFSASQEVFLIPGSWLPLALLMGLFALRFFATGSLVRHPELAEQLSYAALIGLGFGVFAGAFVARSLLIFGRAYGPNKLIVD
ncbi:hypothetical protein KAK06_03265 [Ideonella sp. 4Y11]|uniref:DUF1453 domain-containing protein n=1 Tax=Ideonella aquatica TaxID=2824119 RepID=A0A940YR86_9BURK|nr:DUF6622 family protein [Ideonella aquatica]MBQ0957970.1 hypothetical protein [Ideonella aquatica]